MESLGSYETDPLLGRSITYSNPLRSYSAAERDVDEEQGAGNGNNVNGSGRPWAVAAFCIIACFDSAIAGVMLGFTSGTLMELERIYNDGDRVRGVDEDSTIASMIGSFGALGAVFGGPFAWPISDWLGRKPALMLGGVFSLVGWLLITFAHFVSGSREGFLAMFLIGRLLTGFGAGWAAFAVSVYIAEVAPAKLKGLFGSCNWLLMTIGVVVGYGLGALALTFHRFTYYYTAAIAAGLVVIFELLMLFTKETPRWLLAHGKETAGKKVLEMLRGRNVDIQTEVEGIKQAIEKSKGLSFRETIQAIRYRSVYLPFILSLLLMVFQVFGGYDVQLFYAGIVLKQAGLGGTGRSAEESAAIFSTISVGLVQVIMTVPAVFLVDYLGRRVLLIASSVGLILVTAVLGVHFFIVDRKCHGCLGINCTVDNVTHLNDFSPCNSTNLGWVAVACVALFMTAFSIGWGPIPWISMSELLPLRVRGLLGSIVIMWQWVCIFIITESFESYAEVVTKEFAWWSFTVVMCVSVVFVILFVPETKGHSLEEIEENFEQGRILAVSCECSCCDRNYVDTLG